MTERWYVAVSKQGQEYLAKRELQNQSFLVYLPLCVAEWSRKPKIKPLLPSYLFVQVDTENSRWRAMLSTFGVRTVICSNDKPQAVPSYIVEEIKAREVNGVVQLPPPIQCKFKPGDAVKVKGNPMDAIFAEVLDHRRAAVFLSLLGRANLRTVVPLNRLSAASVAVA